MQILIWFLVKKAISSTPFCPISPQQIPLSQYCMKPKSFIIFNDERIIFNHENTSAAWINWFRIIANRATLSTKLSPLGFEDSNRTIKLQNCVDDKLFLSCQI